MSQPVLDADPLHRSRSPEVQYIPNPAEEQLETLSGQVKALYHNQCKFRDAHNDLDDRVGDLEEEIEELKEELKKMKQIVRYLQWQVQGSMLPPPLGQSSSSSSSRNATHIDSLSPSTTSTYADPMVLEGESTRKRRRRN